MRWVLSFRRRWFAPQVVGQAAWRRVPGTRRHWVEVKPVNLFEEITPREPEIVPQTICICLVGVDVDDENEE
ncbi:hypothetical protein SAMN05444320_104486 [Streptoalloteichus hindustanus]|uniref:Uncharacterized protein n=1 Tax=Streptoalloteichus hindustanus TaxID=2017 RepID=A0A1M5DJT0_STRHI|nr:hypothetical protein SAMN05444320_104486 [Streptoalloteichus hindustanus]